MGIRSVIGWTFALVGTYFGQGWAVAVGQGMIARDNYLEQKKARRRAIQAYNDSVQDRLEMLDLQPSAPRTLVLGRVRFVEGVRRRWTSGTNEELLTMIVSFAGHEIDAFESWYLDDVPVTLNGSGYVTTAPYAVTTTQSYTVTGNVLDGSGAAVVVLPATPVDALAVWAVWSTGSGDAMMQGGCSISVVGTTATVTGGTAGADLTIGYTGQTTTSYVRIRPYLGTSAQNVGSDLAAEYPGKITATDEFQSIALAVVDITYNPDIFPQGRPTVTAILRGAKCYDPRTTTTVWTENPALHALHYATWTHGWALDSTDYVMADVTAAANVCDVSTVFPLDTGDVTLVRHRCGITIDAAADHAEAMDAIFETMNGRHGWAGGKWRFRAGTLGSTAATITQDWLVSNNSGGNPDGEPVITAVQALPRTQRINRVTGSCVDPSQRYQLLPFPAVEDAVLIAAYGERAIDVQFSGVTHIAHAQHLASMAIRQAQAGLRVELTLNEYAARLELFDVVAVTMARYGFSAKTFEVVGWTWSQAGAYKVVLAEITAALFTVESVLLGRDPAPDSDLRPPWDVEQITGLAVTSGTTALTDGSILTRTALTWDAVTGESIRQGGSIEIQYVLATETLPTGEWPSWLEQGSSTGTTIPGLMANRFYLFRARAVQAQPLVRGLWSDVVLHQVADVPTISYTAGQYTDIVFKRAATIPATPTGDVPAGWYDAPPAADGNPLWVSYADKTGAGVLISAWSTPVQAEGGAFLVQYSTDGTGTGGGAWHTPYADGTDFYARFSQDNGATWSGAFRIVGEAGHYLDIVFKRAATAPATPTGSTPAGWSDAPPAADGTPLWTSWGEKTSGGTLIGTWSAPVQVEGGAFLVEYATTSTGTWHSTFTTGDLYSRFSSDNGATWSAGVRIVGEGGSSLIVSNEAHPIPADKSGTVTSYAGSGTVLSVWEGAVQLTYDGVGTSPGTWTVASKTVTTGTITVGATSDTGATATIADHSAMTTDVAVITYALTGTSTTGLALALSKTQTITKVKVGADGATGDTGATGGTGATGDTGQSNHRVYKAVTIGSPPSTPGTTTSGATPSGWSATPLTLTTGQEQYQSDGTTPAGSTTTTWGTPYPSYLKVGSLEAISAAMGSLTSGTITGAVVRTAASGARIVLDYSTNTFTGYTSGGTQTLTMDADLGTVLMAGANASYLLYATNNGAGSTVLGENTSTGPGVHGTGSSVGVYGYSSAGYGITAETTSGTALRVVGPMTITSTALVSNLNADKLDSKDWEAPGSIGNVTPAAGAFTTLSATGTITSTKASGAPFSILSTDLVSALNADMLDGQHGSYYTPNNGTLTLAVSGVGLSGSGSFTANQSGAGSFTVTSNAASANTASAIMARDASGNTNVGTIVLNSGYVENFRMSGMTTGTGASTASFAGTDKPGSASSNSWLTVNINGTTCYIPIWT